LVGEDKGLRYCSSMEEGGPRTAGGSSASSAAYRGDGKITAIVNRGHCGTIIQQVDYVLDELHGYAALRDAETGIEVGACGIS